MLPFFILMGVYGRNFDHSGAIGGDPQFGGGRIREVNNTIVVKGAAVINPYNHLALVFQVGDLYISGKWQ